MIDRRPGGTAAIDLSFDWAVRRVMAGFLW